MIAIAAPLVANWLARASALENAQASNHICGLENAHRFAYPLKAGFLAKRYKRPLIPCAAGAYNEAAYGLK